MFFLRRTSTVVIQFVRICFLYMGCLYVCIILSKCVLSLCIKINFNTRLILE